MCLRFSDREKLQKWQEVFCCSSRGKTRHLLLSFDCFSLQGGPTRFPFLDRFFFLEAKT